MKTERRHELQTNVLADWIGHKTDAIRPYTKLIVGGVGAVFIVAIAATFISNQQFEQSARGWADYFAASSGDSTDRLRSVAEDHAGTLPALWAMQREADLELARGIRALYTNRGESTDALAAARKLYGLVEAGATGQPMLKQAAQFGSAQAFEAEGDLDKAKDWYQKAIAAAKDSSLGKQAEVRLETLQDAEAAEFLTWFSRQTPQPRAPEGQFPGGFPGGGDDVGGLNLPRDLTELPGRPDVTVPDSQVQPGDRASALPTTPKAAPAPESTEAEPTETAPKKDAAASSTATEPDPSADAPPANPPATPTSEESKPEESKPEESKPEESKPAAPAPPVAETPAPTDGAATPAKDAQPNAVPEVAAPDDAAAESPAEKAPATSDAESPASE